MRKLLLYLLACAILFMVAYLSFWMNPKINLSNKHLSAAVHVMGKQKEGPLPGNSPAITTIQKILDNKQRNWRITFVTYAPRGMRIDAHDLHMNIGQGLLVADCTGWFQVKTDLTGFEEAQIYKALDESIQPENKQ